MMIVKFEALDADNVEERAKTLADTGISYSRTRIRLLYVLVLTQVLSQ